MEVVKAPVCVTPSRVAAVPARLSADSAFETVDWKATGRRTEVRAGDAHLDGALERVGEVV